MKEKTRFLTLREVLEKAKKSHPEYAKRLQEAQAMGRWEACVGKTIARHTKAATMKNGVLWVEVHHPVWRAELHHRKYQILKKLNEGNPELIHDLYLVDPRHQSSAKRLFVQKAQHGKKRKPNESN